MGRRVHVPEEVEPESELDRISVLHRRALASVVTAGRATFDLDREAFEAGLRGLEAAEYVLDKLGLMDVYERAVEEFEANRAAGRNRQPADAEVVNRKARGGSEG